ncbi:MAG TPA: cysteine desulfurase family protein [Gemmataceae bacterium]|nr:cysteine desulfurase family protein [Gemmataceae bacterium]
MDLIYIDNNATTPTLPAVWEAMRPYLTDAYGNPASAHRAGRRARQALEDARERVAALLGAQPDEVIFTSGATEANNLAVFGLAGDPPGHVVASPIEHPSVAEPLRRLQEIGFRVAYLPADRTGGVRAEALAGLLRPETRLVTVMLANNETGAIQPIADCRLQIADWAMKSAICNLQSAIHCDAVQAVGRVPVHFGELGVTSLSLSAHKFHGPRGVGALLLRRGTKLRPLFFGGHQQHGRRPGTEPVALAVGLATALELAEREGAARRERVLALRRRLLDALRREAAPVVLNGPEEGGIPHTLNLSFPGCRADALLMVLDLAGVACSTGSACSSGSLLPSPVLKAMGVHDEVLHSAMRFSLSALLSEAEIDEAARRIAAAVRRLRATGD